MAPTHVLLLFSLCTHYLLGQNVKQVGWFKLEARNVFLGDCHAVFLIQTVKFAHVFSCAVAKTSPGVFLFVVAVFSSVKIFMENVDHLVAQIFRQKHTTKYSRRSGLGMGMHVEHVQKFSVYLSKKGVDILTFVHKN